MTSTVTQLAQWDQKRGLVHVDVPPVLLRTPFDQTHGGNDSLSHALLYIDVRVVCDLDVANDEHE
eukprot:CAMPEP_0116898186 /NCGR_PEP_ID=MMETSP0467-20121206/6948_1 /TAXON_ID=283647 /ORGANISM="Mesodinium pulex, Strain SPMC105" /LENGTH=64 /DNA_ID=CAMNT_0004570141 /DNA_START=1670 /DNA_END=1865 /DNA_ORIENTATION=+